MLGRVVGSYRIVEKIGEGGMGAVYRAVDEMLDREVAVKAIRPELAREPQIVERFRAEAKILAKVNHPAIATIYSFFHDGGELFLAMEYVRGRTLGDVLAAGGALPWQRAVALLASALEGIEQAHRAGIVHRDLKPDNLMLTDAGALKVMDFGIARVTGSGHMTRTGLLLGTLRYVAPEQIRGEEVDRRTDVYALGAVLYQMLTGRVPFDGPTDFAILKAQLEDPPPPPSAIVPGLPEWLDRAVVKALEKEPAARFQTVAEMRAFLLAPEGTAAARRETVAELPTLVLPPRPASHPGTAAASPATIETGRPRLPAAAPPSPPTVATGPPLGPGTSYRPVTAAGWKRGAIGALLGVAALAVAVSLWPRREPAAPPAQAPGPAPASSQGPLQTAAPGPVADEPTPAASPRLEAASQPPVPVRPRKTAPQAPAPAAPSPAATTAEETPVEKAAPPPAAPETPPPSITEPAPAAGELPYAELHQIVGELVERSEKLGELYGTFLEQKEDGGAELTESDQQLQDELETLTDAAGSLGKRLKEGFFTRGRLRNPQNRTEVVKRAQTLAEVIGRVERLMTAVQPGPEVRQEWQEVRQRWRRVAQLVSGR